MKHETLVEIRQKAEIVALGGTVAPMSRRERLERWAAVLERHGGRVQPFIRIEDFSPEDRRSLRGEETPLTVAFADPVLRDEGLRGDSLGDAMTFFTLTHGQTHRLLCDCHYRGRMTAAGVADRLRTIAKGGIVQRLWNWGMGRRAAG